MKILILEDEQQAGEKLLSLVREQLPESSCDWHRTVVDAIVYLREQPTPDLIFADVELLDGNVFQVFDLITPSCPIIFCTAYDHFYTHAFQTNGIAYLLKPYSQAQFEEAVSKYERLFAQAKAPDDSAALLQQLSQLLQQQPKHYKNSFTVRKARGIYLLQAEEVAYFRAQGDFVEAIDRSGARHLLSYTLQSLEALLDPTAFCRINRSELIAFGVISNYEQYTKNRLAIGLKGSKEVLYTSNSRSPAFRQWLEEH